MPSRQSVDRVHAPPRVRWHVFCRPRRPLTIWAAGLP
jgi:hypothetical protein